MSGVIGNEGRGLGFGVRVAKIYVNGVKVRAHVDCEIFMSLKHA
jgi:hypothetical protein